MTITADTVFITPDTDHATLAVDELPRTAALLPCGSCGELRDRHWKASRSGACATFTRPALPPGYAYLDTLTPGAHIRRRSRPRHGSERIVHLTDHHDRAHAVRLLLMQADTRDGSAVAYITPDTIVEVLEATDPLGR